MADISIIQDECFDDPDDGDPSDGGECDSGGFSHDEESLTPCAKLEKYAHSDNIFNRQMVPTILLEIFRDSSPECITADLPTLLAVIHRIADDTETAVRTDLVQRIPHLAAACAEFSSRVPALGSVVIDHLLPLVVKYLGDADNQLRNSTHATLLTLMEQGLVPRHAIETQVCPKVLHFTYADSLMDYHTGAITLMSKMVPLLGRETTERLFLQRFSELCSNSMFYIRKICASSFGEFCAVLGTDAYENILLPCFIELCNDEIWGVRKACAEVVMTVSCACSPESRRAVLAPAFIRLLQDQSRWVRMSAFQTLGPFISTFADPSIIGLAYNQLGELVLINPEGTEFRINSPAFSDANLKAAADFKQRFYQAQERIVGKNSTLQFFENSDMDTRTPVTSNSNFHQDTSDKTDNTDLSTGEEESCSDLNLTNNLNILNEEEPNSNIEIVIGDSIETNTDYAEEVTENIVDSDGDFIKNVVNCETNGCDDSEAVTDIGETLTQLNLDVCTEDCEECTSVNDENNASTSTDKDELEKFNLYQYWYINPDLPLDPNIVESCRSPKKDTDSNFINRLENLDFNDFNSSWNPAFNDTKRVNETIVLEKTFQIQFHHHKFTQEIVPQLLIDHFVSMTDPDLAANTDNDMAYHCAFSLPAVALTLGRSNWFMLKRTCEILASNMQYKIRRTVASCLHELALILGQEIAADHLLPIFDGFIKDLDEVRIGVLKHLANFLKLIGPEKRNNYLPRLGEFLQTDNEWNWRFREELANQLLMAVPLFQPIDASKHIAKLAQELLCDKVYAVRQVALLLVTELVRHVSGEPNITSWLLIKLAEEFAHSKRWVRRQAFALLCSRLISNNALPPAEFCTIVMPHLLDLSWDPVPNVRLAVSRTISRDIIVHDYFSDVNNDQHEPVHTVLRRLQSDKDRDVRHYAMPLTY